MAPSVTAWAHAAFPELRADGLYHQLAMPPLTHSGPQPDPRLLARPPAPCFEFYTSEAGHDVFNREGAVLALSCRRPE
jgi:hypothetical protein